MPTYDYECGKCKHRFELRRSYSDSNGQITRCPKCKGRAERIFTSVPVIFKGAGFYVTDHRKTGPGETESTPAPATDKKTVEKAVEKV